VLVVGLLVAVVHLKNESPGNMHKNISPVSKILQKTKTKDNNYVLIEKVKHTNFH
jgi:hypothetical protein